MPNTLAHIALQTLVTKGAVRTADPKWIYVGAVIPDVPWILRRVVEATIPGIDPMMLRYYVDVQGTLLFSVLACAVIALITSRVWFTFVLLASNAVLHLVLDAMQTKWGNGVHFFAPFSWELTNWGLFWPESALNVSLTVAGIMVVLAFWRQSIRASSRLTLRNLSRSTLSAALCLAYLSLPILFLNGPYAANNHYLRTFADESGRGGSYVEMDRAPYVPLPEGGRVVAPTGQSFETANLILERSAILSVRGRFTNNDRLLVGEYHEHWTGFRDVASVAGLGMVALLWLLVFVRGHVKIPGSRRSTT